MTQDEIDKEIAKPEHAGRAHIICHEEGPTEAPVYVAEWDGREVRAENPFGLDGALHKIGAPAPRNLYLLDREATS